MTSPEQHQQLHEVQPPAPTPPKVVRMAMVPLHDISIVDPVAANEVEEVVAPKHIFDGSVELLIELPTQDQESKVFGSIDTMRVDIDNLTTERGVINDKSAAVESEISREEIRIMELEEKISILRRKVAARKTTIEGLRSNITANEQDQEALLQQQANLATQIEEVPQDIRNIIKK